MIIVSGTRRAGTSMWMQILEAAGLPVVGERFPGNWQQTLRAANPHGFYESLLRHGIFYRTNPHPGTGEFIRAHEVPRHAVKIFIPGLIRTDFAYLDRVVVTVRPWREYEASVGRLYALEDEAVAQQARDDATITAEQQEAEQQVRVSLRMPPALEWWDEHYALVRDLSVRGYACHVQSFAGVLADPRRVLGQTFAWLDLNRELDLEAAVAVVESRTGDRPAPPESDAVEPEVAAVFDAFYEAVHGGQGLDAPLIERMNALNEQLAPRIATQRERIARIRGHQSEHAASPDDSPFCVLPGEWA